MNDLNYYSLLVAVKTFDNLDSNVLDAYCASPNRLPIDDLFLTLATGTVIYDNKDLDTLVDCCTTYSSMICHRYEVDESVIPIFSAYMIPHEYKPKNDSESDRLVSIFEEAIAIDAKNSTPAWYLREGIKYRLMPLYESITKDTSLY